MFCQITLSSEAPDVAPVVVVHKKLLTNQVVEVVERCAVQVAPAVSLEAIKRSTAN